MKQTLHAIVFGLFVLVLLGTGVQVLAIPVHWAGLIAGEPTGIWQAVTVGFAFGGPPVGTWLLAKRMFGLAWASLVAALFGVVVGLFGFS